MAVLITALGIVLAALYVWLAVRIINRRERWAKCTLVAAIALPVLYVLSFRSACQLVDRGHVAANPIAAVYRPLLHVIVDGPQFCQSALTTYACGSADDPSWLLTRLLGAGGFIHGPSLKSDAPHRTTRPD